MNWAINCYPSIINFVLDVHFSYLSIIAWVRFCTKIYSFKESNKLPVTYEWSCRRNQVSEHLESVDTSEVVCGLSTGTVRSIPEVIVTVLHPKIFAFLGAQTPLGSISRKIWITSQTVAIPPGGSEPYFFAKAQFTLENRRKWHFKSCNEIYYNLQKQVLELKMTILKWLWVKFLGKINLGRKKYFGPLSQRKQAKNVKNGSKWHFWDLKGELTVRVQGRGAYARP